MLNKYVNLTILICLLVAWSTPLVAQSSTSKSSSYEAFNVLINFENIGDENFSALYDERSGNLFLPVAELFSFVRFTHIVNDQQQSITGFTDNEKSTFSIQYPQKAITYQKNLYAVSDKDMIMDNANIYLSRKVFEEVFKFKVDFDFRSLGAKFTAPFELPLARSIRLQNIRNNLKKAKGEVVFDSIIPRKYNLFKFGMVDWSVASNQSQVYTNETRIGLGVGAELALGEADVWLNYSDKYGLDLNQQRYQWRWVDNKAKFIKQFQLGRVYSRSVASLFNPVDGFMFTNTPTTIRKTLGEYPISDYTQPEWTVELYINNNLVDFVKADVSGHYSFNVPIVYGTSNITLRFYGPNGEEKSQQKTIFMPFNLLPKGEFEYRVTGGYLLDTIFTRHHRIQNKYGRAEVNYGITRWLTMGAGMEYLSTIVGNDPYIPFINASITPLPKLIINAEYAHNVRTKATLNYSLPLNMMLDVNYSIYKQGQTAILYNYLEERVANLSVPFHISKFSGNAKMGFRQNIYPSFSYKSGELYLSGNYYFLNVNMGNYFNWTNSNQLNAYTNLSVGTRLGNGFNTRLSAQYSYSEKILFSYRAEVEKQIFQHGYLNASYENNILSKYNSFNISLRYDFSFMSAYVSSYFSRGPVQTLVNGVPKMEIQDRIQTSESARGSFAFGSGKGYVHVDKQNSVGRCGISIIPYVDVNHNGKYDTNEPGLDKLNVRCNGGQVLINDKDSIVRIVGLEPFTDYTLTFDEANLSNLAWKIICKNICVTTDPNQFKKIYIGVEPMGEVTGLIVNNNKEGMGRILLNIKNQDGKFFKQIQSEGDGYFNFLGLPPGKYTVCPDSVQLSRIDKLAESKSFTITPSVNGDLVDIGEMTLKTPYIPQAKVEQVKDTVKIVVENKKFKEMIDYPVVFDFDKYNINPINEKFLNKIAVILKMYPDLSLRIEGHTDSIGTSKYNQKLSERRANAVKKYLMKKGISGSRLDAIGYGKTKPLNKNKSQEERKRNRRVIFVNNSEYKKVNLDSLLSNINLPEEHLKSTNYAVKVENVSLQFDREVKNQRTDYTIRFESGSAVVAPKYFMVLKKLAGIIKDNPCVKIKIEGHTDSDGSLQMNQKLSEKRSLSIQTYLTKQGVDASHFILVGWGETKPLNKNKNKAEKAINRRGELINTSNADCKVNVDSILSARNQYEIILTTGNCLIKDVILNAHDGKYYLQIGSFKSKATTDDIFNRVDKVLPGKVYVLKEKGYNIIRVGKFDTKQEAKSNITIIEKSLQRQAIAK